MSEQMGNLTSRNVVSVSWGDHLQFGEGDGRLADPGALERRLTTWKEELAAGIVLWRELRSRLDGYFYSGDQPPVQGGNPATCWDDFAEVCRLCHAHRVAAYLYVTLFDEGWPLADATIREISYHNAMHGRHLSFQSRFSRDNPEYAVVDRTGRERQWGVLSLAYPEVRNHFISLFTRLLEGYPFDGLFVCLRSQSKPAYFGDQFGFNEALRDAFEMRYETDILETDFHLKAWRNLRGEFLTRFLADLRESLASRHVRLAVGVPRGDVIGPPMGNQTLDWRSWLRQGLVDDLIIDQNSSQCPSMWHSLWPMHRGYGYLQNYLDGLEMPELTVSLDRDYGPLLEGTMARLFLSRQWKERDPAEESRLLDHPSVSGLVFSSFRFDNPGPVERNDWRIRH